MMYRRGQRPVLAILLAMFALTFVAALIRRYPYGGHDRLMQFLVPAIAVGCGLGGARLLARVPRAEVRRRLTAALLIGLAGFGAGVCGRDVLHPYHFIFDDQHRAFARRFWRDEPESITICSLTDLGQEFCRDGWYSFYRCNQKIYSPPHHAGESRSVGDIDILDRSIRLVVYRPPNRRIEPAELAECLKQFAPHFHAAGHESHEQPRTPAGIDLYGGYEVFRFVPREDEKLARADAFHDPGFEIED
jgi:hypothetical protein